MKVSEVRELSTEELAQKERDLVRELWRARFDNHSNQLDDTSKISKLRKDIARVKTILSERQRKEGQE